MTATALDPKTALVVIDLQNGLAGYPCIHPFADIVASTARLAAAFRAKGLPVILVTVGMSADGADAVRTRTDAPRRNLPSDPSFFQVVAALDGHATDLRIVKRQSSAFYGTDIDLQLRRRGITGIVLTGVATSNGVDSTARAAHERAYNITFVSDAITDVDPVAHELAMTKQFPRLGEIDTTDAVLRLLYPSAR